MPGTPSTDPLAPVPNCCLCGAPGPPSWSCGTGFPPPYGQPAAAYHAAIPGVGTVFLKFHHQDGTWVYYTDTGMLPAANWILQVTPCGRCDNSSFSAMRLYQGSFVGPSWYTAADFFTGLCTPADPQLAGTTTLSGYTGGGSPGDVVVTAV